MEDELDHGSPGLYPNGTEEMIFDGTPQGYWSWRETEVCIGLKLSSCSKWFERLERVV